MIPRRLCLIALALGGAGTAAAASAPVADFTAENFTSTATETILQGHARYRDGPALFTADEIRIDRATDTIEARGQVIFTRGRERLLADTLVYHRGTRTFHATRIRLGRPPFFVSGESADGSVQRDTGMDGEPSNHLGRRE